MIGTTNISDNNGKHSCHGRPGATPEAHCGFSTQAPPAQAQLKRCSGLQPVLPQRRPLSHW